MLLHALYEQRYYRRRLASAGQVGFTASDIDVLEAPGAVESKLMVGVNRAMSVGLVRPCETTVGCLIVAAIPCVLGGSSVSVQKDTDDTPSFVPSSH